MGTKNNPGDYDCYQHAHPDEPMFVLLGRDPLAGLLVRLWAEARAELGATSEEKLAEAYRSADAMGSWAIDERKSVAVAKAALHKIMTRRVDPLSEASDLPSELEHPANKLARAALREERLRSKAPATPAAPAASAAPAPTSSPEATWWPPNCDNCREPLTEPGALLFSPPDEAGECMKLHLCSECYEDVRP